MKRLASCILVAVSAASLAAAAPAPPEPQGYRMEAFRGPTPETLHGATVLSTAQAHDLWQKHEAVFIDVLPQPPRPVGLPASTIWRPKSRFDIPGSVWLPDTGYGALAPSMEDYFRHGLRDASGGNPARTMVFYCLAECWMSWNAAKRALTMGYTHVAWYPEGTDGWKAHGFPEEERQPMPRPSESE
ncbi:MAG TPA: PQQ-dependent catabolism-associated CXXCW motif protein [Acetobacteraceae bacterium]|nr:PQQ-dependent catabolism-associated CXXCW motif protein [Acetobacteraceae bacterium]